MTIGMSFTGTSSRGSVVEALAGAVAAASSGLKADHFTYTLKEISGTVVRATGAHDLAVTIAAEAIGETGSPPAPPIRIRR